MNPLHRAYQNMTDAQAMSYAPPGEEPPWGDDADDNSDNEKTLDWDRPDLEPDPDTERRPGEAEES